MELIDTFWLNRREKQAASDRLSSEEPMRLAICPRACFHNANLQIFVSLRQSPLDFLKPHVSTASHVIGKFDCRILHSTCPVACREKWDTSTGIHWISYGNFFDKNASPPASIIQSLPVQIPFPICATETT